MKPFLRFLLLLSCLLTPAARAAESARELLVRAILAEDDAEKRTLLGGLAAHPDDAIPGLLTAWRSDQLFIHAPADGPKTPVQLVGAKDESDRQEARRVADGQLLRNAAGQPLRLAASDLTAVEHDASLRRAMKAILDLAELAAPDPEKRRAAVQAIGLAQSAEKLPALEARLK